MSAINNDGKIQEPAKPVHDELADELDSILKQETTKLPGSVQSEAEAMMSQLENIPTFHPVREFNAGTPVAHTFEQSVEEVNIQPEAKQGTVHETQGKKVQGEQVNVPSQPQSLTRPTKPLPDLPTSESQKQEKPAMHTPDSKPISTTVPQRRERAAMKELFNPDQRIGAVAKNTLQAQNQVKPEGTSTPPVIAQKMSTTETKESEKANKFEQIRERATNSSRLRTGISNASSMLGQKLGSIGQKIKSGVLKLPTIVSNLLAKASDKLFPAKTEDKRRESLDEESIKGTRTVTFADGTAPRSESGPIETEVDNLESASPPVEEKASQPEKKKLGNPIAFIKEKLSASTGSVKSTESTAPKTVSLETHVANLRNIVERFDLANNEIPLLADNKELHAFGLFIQDRNFEIEMLLDGKNTGPSLQDDIKRSALGDTKIGEQLLKAKSSDEMLEILATKATEIREILDTPEYEI